MATQFHLSSLSSSSSSDSSSSSESSSSIKLIDLSYRSLSSELLEKELVEWIGDEVNFEFSSLVEKILAYNNRLEKLPIRLGYSFINLRTLDFSNNLLRTLPYEISQIPHLTHLYLRNNLLSENSFPKEMFRLTNLRDLNLSGNHLTEIPNVIYSLSSLRNLFLGSNRLTSLNSNIKNLIRLKVFYLGGNALQDLPDEIGSLTNLIALILCENSLKTLPKSLCSLNKLKTLQLHSNRLTILPHQLIHLESLTELSLRNNPLVHRFVREMEIQPPSLLELSARLVKIKSLVYSEFDLPLSLIKYLETSHRCVNPQCNGVYFHTKIEQVKFVDFCGKYKIPLMQYLCSTKCKSDSGKDVDAPESSLLKRVLLG